MIPVAADRIQLDGSAVLLGEIQINQSDRLSQLPAEPSIALKAQLGSWFQLRGADLSTAELAPGDTVALTLYWQVETQPDRAYTVFVHLLDSTGETVTQVDRWPANSPSDTWAAGQVMVDEYALVLPADVHPGSYRLRIGLYDAVSGVRLAVLGTDEIAQGDHLILPVALEVR